MQGNKESVDSSPLVTAAGWVAVTLFFILLTLITAPFGALLGEGLYSAVGAVHGMLATLGIIIGSVATYLGWRLYTGKLKAFSDLKVLSVLSSLIAAGTIIFGNWIYIAYRGTGGPRAYFLANNPAVHNIFFEFKEFIALFGLPLSVAVAFVIWRYGVQTLEDRPLRSWLFSAVMIGWSALVIAFMLGAAITRLKGV